MLPVLVPMMPFFVLSFLVMLGLFMGLVVLFMLVPFVMFTLLLLEPVLPIVLVPLQLPFSPPMMILALMIVTVVLSLLAAGAEKVAVLFCGQPSESH